LEFIPHSRSTIRTKALNLLKRVKGKGNEVEDMFNASVGWVDLFKN
jgi:hypothetical protein